MKKLEKILVGLGITAAFGTGVYLLSKVPAIKPYFDGNSYLRIYHIDVSNEPESRSK